MFTAFVLVEECVGYNFKGGVDRHTDIKKSKFYPEIIAKFYKSIR